MWQNVSILNISKHVFFIHKYKNANDEDMGIFIFVKKEKYSLKEFIRSEIDILNIL